jgi:hypothetical protein
MRIKIDIQFEDMMFEITTEKKTTLFPLPWSTHTHARIHLKVQS